MATWALPPAAGAGGIEWAAPVEVAVGDAYRGPWRMNESRFLFVDDPTVAFDDSGGVVIAWADQSIRDVLVQRFDAGGYGAIDEPVNVSRSGDTYSWLPRVQVSGDDVYVLWQEIVFSGGSHGGEIYFARSGDAGQSFTDPQNLSRTIAGAGKGRLTPEYWHNGSLDLALGPESSLYAAWTEYEGGLYVSRSTDGGRSFSDPLQLARGGEELPARGPSLAVTPDGTVYLAWTVGEDAGADIRVAWSSDGARSFEDPVRVAPDAGHADAPELAAAPDGALHLVYAHSEGAPEWRYRVLYTRATPAGGRPEFAQPRVIADGEGLANVHHPTMAASGDGRVMVIWERFPEPRRRPVGLGHALSPDGGETFTAPSVVPGSDDSELGFNGSQQGLLMRKLAIHADGGVAVVNSHYAHGEASRIRLYRGVWR